MRLTSILAVSPLVLALGASLALADQAAPPFADDPDAPKVPPKPERRAWTVETKPFTFASEFVPGIPEAGNVVEVTVSAIETPKTPDPRWGSTVPLSGAQLVAELSSPAGEVLRSYVLHPVPLAQGKYAFHFTATEAGIHGLSLKGKLADGRAVNAKMKVPVDVWPLPKELEGSGAAGAPTRRRALRRPVSK